MKSKTKQESLCPEDYKRYVIGEFPLPKEGEPCGHKECLNHRTHPCEGCDRISGSSKLTRDYYMAKGNK